MVRCRSCGTDNLEGSRYCDECGTKLASVSTNGPGIPDFKPIPSGGSGLKGANITSVGIPPLVEPIEEAEKPTAAQAPEHAGGSHATLIIERGESANTEFQLATEESYIGRWDADNGIFPDVDLDAHDPDAKVSRRHARILFRNGIYMIEDLGSTNGTFVNRGRRLIPGSPQVLTEGDEIIVGKTFLRFHISN